MDERASWRAPSLGPGRVLELGAGHRIRAHVTGEGPPIVFVHGALVNANLWLKVVPRLDGFKRVNDEEGHATGDEVLRAVALRFRAVARTDDLVARLGGDEFAVLANGVHSRDEAVDIGQRFVDALKNPVLLGNRAYAVGVAVGVAFHPEDGTTAEELMHSADLAMYGAKATKRSGLRLFSPAAAAKSA